MFLLSTLWLNALTTSAASAPGTTYYIDATNGNDEYTGKSPSQAWRALNKVYDEFANGTFKGGDSILFKRGETWTATNWGRLRVRNVVGTSEETPLYIGAYGSGDKPVLNGYWQLWTYILGSGYDEPGVDHVIVEDLTLLGSNSGIIVLGGPVQPSGPLYSVSHWTLRRITANHGIQIKHGWYITIDECDFSSYEGGGSPLYIGEGGYAGYEVGYVSITNSHIHDSPYECIDLKSDTHHITIEGNVLEDAANEVISLRGNNHIVRNNVISNPNGGVGIASWYYAGYGDNHTIENNLIKDVNGSYGDPVQPEWDSVGILISGGSGHVIRNNTIANIGRHAVWLNSTANVTLRNNIYYDLGGYGLLSYTEIPDSDYNRYPLLASKQIYLDTGGGQQSIAQACATHGIECHSPGALASTATGRRIMKTDLWKLIILLVLTMLVPVLALAGCPSRRYAARCREEKSEK